MTGWEERLSTQQIADVQAYLKSSNHHRHHNLTHVVGARNTVQNAFFSSQTYSELFHLPQNPCGAGGRNTTFQLPTWSNFVMTNIEGRTR